MVFIAVGTVPVGSKPPVALRVRIAAGQRHGFGAAAPLSTRAPSLEQGRAGDPVDILPKLVRQIGGIDLGRRVIPTYHSFCCVLHTIASLGV